MTSAHVKTKDLTREELITLARRLVREHAGTNTAAGEQFGVTPQAIGQALKPGRTDGWYDSLLMRIVEEYGEMRVEKGVVFRVHS